MAAAAGLLKFRNRAVTVLRGTAVDEFGDESDVGQPYLTGVPAAIAETTDVVFDQATQRPQVVRTITCVMPYWADVDDTDTLYDPATGYYYLIESQQARPGPGYYPADRILTLRMRSGITLASG
jgi:hypothetical protein